MTLTSTITTKGQVTIPLFIREALGLLPSDKVLFIKENDKVYLRPAVDFLDLAGSIKTKKPFDLLKMKEAAKQLVSKRHAQDR